MWHFLEGVLFLSVEKNVKQRPVPYTHQDVTFRRHFFASDKKKKEAGATAFYGGKRKRTVLPSWQTDRLWLLVKHK